MINAIELRHLTKLELSLMASALCILCIAFLSYTLYINKKGPWYWKTGQTWGMLQLFAASVLIFVPFWSRYAAVTGMWGVFFLTLSSAITRGQEARQRGLSETEGRKAIIWATVLAVVIGLLAAPAFTLISNQEVIKGTQKGAVGTIYELLSEIKDLRAEISTLRQERRVQAAKDSAIRAKIFNELHTVSGQLARVLLNDKEVKSALKKKDKAALSSRPVGLPVYPTLKPTAPTGIISPERVKPVQSVDERMRKRQLKADKKGQKVSYEETQEEDPEAEPIYVKDWREQP